MKNRTDSVVNLYLESDSSVTWKVDGIGFSFPPEISVDPGDSLFLVEKSVTVSDFRNAMQINPDVQTFNFDGQLKNSTEIISIMKPIAVENDTLNPYVWVNLEKVEYDDDIPWPVTADGDGYALQRLEEEDFANDVSNWGTILNTLPDANAGVDRRVRINSSVTLDGSRSYDPQDNPLTYQWELITKPSESTAQLTSTSLMQPGITPDKQGLYTFTLLVNNGQVQSTPSFVSLYAYQNRKPYAIIDANGSIAHVDEAIPLNGKRSYDPDFEEIFYYWEVVNKPEESIAEIQSSESKVASFTPDVTGYFQFSLIVNDGELYSSSYLVGYNVRPSVGNSFNNLTNKIQVYPNPTHGDITIDLNLITSTSIDVSLLDINGREVYSNHLSNFPAGSEEFSINMNDLQLEEGLYILQIQSDAITANEKILFIK